ncbi:Rne/Rng family ribonuclease [Nocardioides sp. WS12]|uniref:Rne/Rng family ribonuclease n=1 Tax=Nocardioides sp. WS12 TaxID=2486272 RepID=UPI0015FE0597|nr:Rne/Rng family ribonuclease [Nocardioides sp. WS12]
MTDAPTNNPIDTPGDTPAEAPAEAVATVETPAEASAQKPAAKTAAKKTAPRKTAAKKTTAKKTAAKPEADAGESAGEKPAKKTAAKKTAAKKTTAKKTAAKKTPAKKAAAPTSEQLLLTDEPATEPASEPATEPAAETAPVSEARTTTVTTRTRSSRPARNTAVLFQAPDTTAVPAATDEETEEDEETTDAVVTPADAEAPAAEPDEDSDDDEGDEDDDEGTEGGSTSANAARRRRRRGGRRRRKPAGAGNAGGEGDEDSDDAEGAEGSDSNESDETDESGESTDADQEKAPARAANGGNNGQRQRQRQGGGNAQARAKADADAAAAAEGDDTSDENDENDTDGEGGGPGGSTSSRRRRRRRRTGEGGGGQGGDGGDDPENTVTRVRKPRSAEDEITSIAGSTRLEAKKQRRREGREAGRRRAPIVSEAEFLARRESVERVMVVRQRKDLTQIAVLEDKVLVEHYVARESQTSLIGNVYLGRVQNVLPSMEAAFIDIGKGRNAVLYAGEVNWSALGHKDGQPRKIESVLQSGQTILVQVSKDPIGHKGARLTSQVSLAGRFLVYVPDGTTSGISRKLPDTERSRLKALLKEAVPASAGVIVRTAAEGASEDELTRDVERLKAKWDDIEAKVAKGNAPQLLHGEPDLTLKVVRDLFTEDFSKLVIQGEDAWSSVKEYVDQIAPDLSDRVERQDPSAADLFTVHRIDEQIAKGLDRKVWLPSGGSLVIDRTEAMTVVDVNTGKFTGSGGNLEETVTKNNLEAAEEIVRQLRLRDIGGIIVVDFIDMVLEANRDLVLRRMVECLGRDRTRHQVAEVTSLGLVQMTRKRIGTGLVEAFSETCSHCQGRGLIVHDLPVAPKGGGGGGEPEEGRRSNNRRKAKPKGQGDAPADNGAAAKPTVPSPKDVAAMAKHADEGQDDVTDEAPVVVDEAPVVVEEAPVVVEEAPVVVEEAPVVVEEAPVVVEEAPVVVEEAPVVVEEAPVVVEEAPVEEPAPAPVATTKVVTRTRRSSASRPAGPPAAAVPAVEAPGADAEEPHVAHVPIKKKGAGKR